MTMSLYTGVSALNGFQRGMEVVGNNIANANTYGFKSQRMEYKDSFYDTLNRSVQGNAKGVTSTANQVGGGLQANTISTNFNQGILDSTSVSSDVAIEGRGYFKVLNENDPSIPSELFTRAGNFRVDNEGYLVTSEGYYVQGQSIGAGAVNMVVTGSSDGQGVPADGFAIPTASIQNGALPAAPALPANYKGGAGYLDTPRGSPKVTIVGDGNGAEARAVVTNGVITGIQITNSGSGYTNAVVRIEQPPVKDLNYTVTDAPELGNVGRIRIKTPDFAITPPAASTAINPENVQTLAPQLQTYSILADGTIKVVLDNGEDIAVGKLLLQDFMAPQALSRERGTYFKNDGAAGPINEFNATAGQPGVSGLGILQQGALELSNASITDDFADLILSQRSFQGAARIITTSDEVMREAVNLKR